MVPSAPGNLRWPTSSLGPPPYAAADGRSPASWRPRHSPRTSPPCLARSRLTPEIDPLDPLEGGRRGPSCAGATPFDESADRRSSARQTQHMRADRSSQPRIGLASTSGVTAIATAADVTDRRDSVHISTRDRASVDQGRGGDAVQVSAVRASPLPRVAQPRYTRRCPKRGISRPPGWLPQASRSPRRRGSDWAGDASPSPAMPGFVHGPGYAESSGRAGLQFQAR